jgi:hypothetical protein
MTKQSKKDPNAPAGRIGFDDRGNAVWEWRSDTGTFRFDIDTARVKALQEAAGLELDQQQPPSSGSEPYLKVDTVTVPAPKPQRRTLNDMRNLSEEIKRARAKKDPAE